MLFVEVFRELHMAGKAVFKRRLHSKGRAAVSRGRGLSN